MIICLSEHALTIEFETASRTLLSVSLACEEQLALLLI